MSEEDKVTTMRFREGDKSTISLVKSNGQICIQFVPDKEESWTPKCNESLS